MTVATGTFGGKFSTESGNGVSPLRGLVTGRCPGPPKPGSRFNGAIDVDASVRDPMLRKAVAAGRASTLIRSVASVMFDGAAGSVVGLGQLLLQVAQQRLHQGLAGIGIVIDEPAAHSGVGARDGDCDGPMIRIQIGRQSATWD